MNLRQAGCQECAQVTSGDCGKHGSVVIGGPMVVDMPQQQALREACDGWERASRALHRNWSNGSHTDWEICLHPMCAADRAALARLRGLT